MKKAIIARRTSQALFFAVFFYILWSTTYPLTGIFSPEIFFKADPLLILITSVSERVALSGSWIALVMLAITFLAGRFFCGWVCPLGASIDAIGALNRRHKVLSDRNNRILRTIKFYILAGVGITAIFGKQIAWIFDPIVLMARFVSLNLIPAVTSFFSALFIFLIRDLKLDGAVRDLYRDLKPSLLGVKTGYFSHAWIILAYFIFILATSIILSRFWCRSLCPLGAIYALASRTAPLCRTIDQCKRCGRCSAECRTGAIREDLSYIQGECILCMDCIYACPVRGVKFRFGHKNDPAGDAKDNPPAANKGLSRREFFILMLSSVSILGFRKMERLTPGTADKEPVIRPPGALKEKDFIDRCVRCGNCMKVCITNGLQPVMFESGYSGIWTPRLVPEIGYCEYRCTLCGNTCPTGAIPPLTLEKKLQTRLGIAEVDKSLCIPWAEDKECIVCQEHCPVPEKAITLERGGPSDVQRPRVIAQLCVGCGICQNKCPVRPKRAIIVSGHHSDRASA